MKYFYKYIYFWMTLFFVTERFYGQTINFNYDQNGNRINKQYNSPVSDTPVIQLNAGQLLSNVIDNNQWYLNDTAIAGATAQHYDTIAKGKYNVRLVGNYGCLSAESNSILINTYIFNGDGNWNVLGNWMNQSQPPLSLPGGYDIIVDPKTVGQCILNVPQNISPGGLIKIKEGKKLLIQGALNIAHTP